MSGWVSTNPAAGLLRQLQTYKVLPLPINRRLIAIALTGALIAVLIVGCSDSASGGDSAQSDAGSMPTATFAPADATATWVAFEPERQQMLENIVEQQAASATTIAATQLAMVDDPARLR